MQPIRRTTPASAGLPDRESSYCVWILDTMVSARHPVQMRLPKEVRFIPAHQVRLHMPFIRQGGAGTRTHPWAMEFPDTPPSLIGKELDEHRALWCVDSPQDWVGSDASNQKLTPTEQSLMNTLTSHWGHCPQSIALCHWYTVVRSSLKKLSKLGTPVFVSIGYRGALPERHFWKVQMDTKQDLTLLHMSTTLPATLRQMIQDAWICLQQLQSNPMGTAQADEHMRKVFRTLILPRKVTPPPAFNTHIVPLKRHIPLSSVSIDTDTAAPYTVNTDGSKNQPVRHAPEPIRAYQKISTYV